MSLTLSHILDDLNESQKRAVTTTEGPVLIVAGPGTGKTLTIVRRMAYLMHQGVRPENILAVTFTNRAAREMRLRAEALLGEDAYRGFIGTFHVLGIRIIKNFSVSNPPEAAKEGMKGGVPVADNFVMYTREEQADLLRRLVKESPSAQISRHDRGSRYDRIIEKISRIKNGIEESDDKIRDLYEGYQYALSRNNALDFDDLILKPIDILGSGEILKQYRDTFRYIMVDEYQDINPAQYRLLTLLAGDNGNLCAIGDSDQAIYAFRGADVGNFLSFKKDFKDAKTITLTENYRTKGIIMHASNILIRHNLKRLDKEINPVREDGIPLNVISVPDEKAEGEIIIGEIEERIGGTSHYQLLKHVIPSPQRVARGDPNPPLEKGGRGDLHSENSYSFSDFAVFYRTNAQARAIAEAFDISGIPYQVAGEKFAFRRKETTQILSFLKALSSPAGTSSFQKLNAHSQIKMDQASLKKFQDLKERASFDEFLKAVLEESGISKYFNKENLIFLEDIAGQFRHMENGEAMNNFINEVSLLTPADDFDSGVDAVSLMTLHMAKGLEFRVVFIAGAEDGIIPYTLKKDNLDIEEERRLFYVGMTRAMDELFLVYARKRFMYGQRMNQLPSPFLKEIPGQFIASRFIPDKIKKAKKDEQMGLF